MELKLRDFAIYVDNAIQVCFDWSIFGTPQNFCVDFLPHWDMKMFDDDDFDKFVETDGCPYIDEVKEQMIGTNLGEGIIFEEQDMNQITHWFVNPEENVYFAIIEW